MLSVYNVIIINLFNLYLYYNASKLPKTKNEIKKIYLKIIPKRPRKQNFNYMLWNRCLIF